MKEKPDASQYDVPYNFHLEDAESLGTDDWILHKVFEVPEINKEELILEDWNYA